MRQLARRLGLDQGSTAGGAPAKRERGGANNRTRRTRRGRRATTAAAS
jgi:hypothetical protein